MTDDSNALPTGYNLHRYQIEGVLGAGGFGITYQAIHEALQNQVAIKEYFPVEWAYRDHNNITVRANAQGQMPARPSEPPCYQWGLERFLDEAKILVQINHPGVVRVRDYFTANGSAYIVMEYEQGESLSAILQRGGILPEPELRRLLNDVMPALEAVHSQNYLHRDLKPGNLYVRHNDRRVILLDFGAARQALGRHTRSVTSVVTPGYSPIEQYVTVGEDYGPWTDIYALGAVIYRCITGAPPVEAPGRVLKDPVQPAMEVGAGLYSPGLLQVVDQALAVRPEDRFQSVAAMQQALLAADRSNESVDFSNVPPIPSNLLDFPADTASLRFDPLPPRPITPLVQNSIASTAAKASAAEAQSEVDSGFHIAPLEPPVRSSDLGLAASSEDLSLPMLDNIWENLDENLPAIQAAESEAISPHSAARVAAIAPGLTLDAAPPPVAPPPIPDPSLEPSQSLLKRPPQSALDLLKKSSSRRVVPGDPLSATPGFPASSEAAALPSRRNTMFPTAPPGNVDVDFPIEDAISKRDALRTGHAQRTWMILGVAALLGASGLGLFAYQYYQNIQEERAAREAAVQREQEAVAAQQRQKEAAARLAELTERLAQARQALDAREWARADLFLDRAGKIDPQHPDVQALRAELQAAQARGSVLKTQTNPIIGADFNWVEGGCFNAGSPISEQDRGSDEAVRQICVTGFWMGKHEITNAQFRRFKAAHDSGTLQGHTLNGDTQPAVNLNWDEAQAFAEWLTWETQNGKRLRLPTEAEWEFAARAGATTRYYWGNQIDPSYANFSDRNDPTGASIGNLNDGQAVTAPVGSYRPNALGLHDMAGNIWEWTCSEYRPQYAGEEQRCVTKRGSGGLRVVRGGSWNDGAGELRAARRMKRKPDERNAVTGFRIIMEEPQ